MAKNDQLTSILLLLMTIHGFINFAAGQFGIGYARIPNRPHGGQCRDMCKATEVELNKINSNCGNGFKYCFNPNYSFWGELMKFFTNDDNNNNNSTNRFRAGKKCLVRGNVSGGSTERMTGSTCRETCKKDEEVIESSFAACNSGLICCKDPNYSFWKSWFLSIFSNDKKKLS